MIPALPAFFTYRDAALYLEDVPLEAIAARFGTPSYVYSASSMRSAFNRYTHGFKSAGLELKVCYAVKANSNLSIIKLFGEMGAGADVVSGGELYRALKAGIPADQIFFAGVGKTAAEIDFALDQNIGAFNIESPSELAFIEKRAAARNGQARVSLRVNPDVDAGTHPYITTGKHHNKFGSSPELVLQMARKAAESPALEMVGLQAHIGSQLLQVEPLAEAFARLLALAEKLKKEGIRVESLDLGGGLGVTYQDEAPEDPDRLAAAVARKMEEVGVKGSYQLLAEPGRYLTANAGALLTEVLYLKQEGPNDPCFGVVDAGMNDLIRPALYGAVHKIVPFNSLQVQSYQNQCFVNYEIVGPVCESADFLGRNVSLPPLEEGNKLAILGAGAYGFSMASNYNSRPRPPEILVDGDQAVLIRRRESYSDLTALEE